MTNNRMNAAEMRWALKRSTESLTLFVQDIPARAALKLTNPALHDSRLHYAKAVLTARAARGLQWPPNQDTET